MAQNFRRYTLNNVGTTVASIPNASTFDSYDTIVGISIANIASNQALVDVYINDGTNDIANLIEDFQTIRRSNRDARLKAYNEAILAIKPFLFANKYIPDFQVKKYIIGESEGEGEA